MDNGQPDADKYRPYSLTSEVPLILAFSSNVNGKQTNHKWSHGISSDHFKETVMNSCLT
jgi:hypothetical protein